MAEQELRTLSKTDLLSLTKAMLHEHMGRLSKREREHQAEVIAGVSEVSRRRLCFDFGYPSLFEYMTQGLGFPNASAQRYIDAARLCAVVPTLNEDIARGEVNLSQVTVVAKTVRQKKKEDPRFQMEVAQATRLFEKIKSKDVKTSQQIIAKELKTEIKEQEFTRVQADRSVRYEITLNSEQEELFQRIKELISHVHPNPSFSKVFEYLATEYRKRKDPLVAKGRPKTGNQVEGPTGSRRETPIRTDLEVRSEAKTDTSTSSNKWGREIECSKSSKIEKDRAYTDDHSSQTHFHLEVESRQESNAPQSVMPDHAPLPVRRSSISVHTLREVHRRDRSCRYRDAQTGRSCGSTFQLQADHIQPLWAGGSNAPENLQVLCATHNRLKYRREAGIRLAKDHLV